MSLDITNETYDEYKARLEQMSDDELQKHIDLYKTQGYNCEGLKLADGIIAPRWGLLEAVLNRRKKQVRHLINAINLRGEDADVYVDGIDGMAVCPPVNLTDEGRRHFAAALSLPTEGYCIMGEEKDYDDLFDFIKTGKGEGGRLMLAWDLLKAQAGYCTSSDYDKWFK